jgi:glycosyltransferase involved in cell wall biosynthesis
MTKILFQSPAGGVLNGADMATKWQMKYLVSQGFEVGYVYSDKRALTEDFKAFLALYKIQPFFLEYNWWMAHDLGVPDFQAITEIVKIIDTHHYDVAITVTANIPHLAVAAALTKIPHIWLIHEYPEGEFAYTKAKYDFISQMSTQILAANRDLSEKIGQLIKVPEKVSYFYPFSDANDQVIQEGEAATRLVNVNAFTEGKNNLELIKIFQVLQVSFPDLELVFTGQSETAYGQKCQDYVGEHQIKNVHFLNDFAKNWATVTENDIFVNPSTLETFGLTLVEALKFGVVTISSTNQMNNQMAKLGYLDERHLYPTGDVAAAVAKLTPILMDFESYQKEAKQLAQRVIEEQKLDVISRNIKLAVENAQKNPSDCLSHLKNMMMSSGEALFERLVIIQDQGELLDERIEIIQAQEKTLDERLTNIQVQGKLLDERMKIIQDQAEILDERLAIIKAQENVINQIKSSIIGKVLLRGKL